ncbi:MAG: response regulator transcription factor [Candidatus Eremiobacteraeota bacterium]|nr:response regulator transcription factor [Candidatus Eremiobacteraeota bacterium]
MTVFQPGVVPGTAPRLQTLKANLAEFDLRVRSLQDTLADLRAQQRARLRATRTAPAEAPVLTEREREILRLIADGKNNAEIAQELHFGLGTIKLHVREILETLDAPTRAAAAARALRQGLI